MSDPRLPFPVHGTRFAGGDAVPQHLAQGLGDSARLLYFANLLASTAGVPIVQLTRPTKYGAVTATVQGPLAHKSISVFDRQEEPPADDDTSSPSRLVWLPEGFVITPRTAAAPDGFGMPPTPNGRGTPGGPLAQVIINRFTGNQYPDVLYRLAGGNPATPVYAANLFFMDWELASGEFGIGVTLTSEAEDGEEAVSEFFPQFSARYVTNYREAESGQWVCHRPQHALTEAPLEALMRQEANLVREGAGRAPLAPALRGAEGELAQDIAYQVRWSGVSDHDFPGFRDGHQTFLERVEERVAYARGIGENLHIQSPAGLDANAARVAFDDWIVSPEHYPTMVYDWHAGNTQHAWVSSAMTGSGKATTPEDIGVQSVQIFHGAHEWVASGPGDHKGRAPVTTDGPQAMYRPIYQQRSAAGGGGYFPFVMYRGRTVYITAQEVDVNSIEVLSGTTVVSGGVETTLRVAVLLRPALNAGPCFVVVYDGAIHDFLRTRAEVGRFELPTSSADQVSVPVWSASGEKMAFGFTTLAPVPAGRIQSGIDNPAPTTFVGQQLHFVEFVGGFMIPRGIDSLNIDPTDFSASHQRSWCKGAIRLLPTYGDGETLQYVSVEVDSEVYFSDERFEKRTYGALVFPDGVKVVYADQSAQDVKFGPGTPVRGFVRHILPFDVSDSASVAYIQYDHPELETDLGVSARLVIRGAAVKYSPLAYDSGALGPEYRNRLAFGSAEYTLDPFRGNPYWDPFASKGMSFFGYINDKYTPSKVFSSVVMGDSNVCPPSQLVVGPPGTYTGPVATSPTDTSYVLVGPTILRDGTPRTERFYEDSPSTEETFDRVERYQRCSYKGEWIYAGRIENTLGGTGEFSSGFSPDGAAAVYQRSAWLGDDQYYCLSSLDLKAITGLTDPAEVTGPTGLKDNILPIGVL